MKIRQLIITVCLVSLVAACSSRRGVYHPVAKGQTLYRIGLAYGQDPGYLARVNGITDPTQIKPGQKIFIPRAGRVKSVSLPPSPKQRTGAESASLTAKPRAKSSESGSRTTTPPPNPVKGKFGYPIKGKIVKSFGTQAGRINQGVEFSAPFGSPVISAAAGKVIYSGNGIKGYGNLIILKHADSFYTVYGFNAKNLVASGVEVKKGDKIALCGNPPGGDNARLHFEIRHGKKAVNPIFYLP